MRKCLYNVYRLALTLGHVGLVSHLEAPAQLPLPQERDIQRTIQKPKYTLNNGIKSNDNCSKFIKHDLIVLYIKFTS